MSVLVTGASGKLGQEIIKCLSYNNISYISYSHSMPIEDLNWSDITTIVNCAAVLPSDSATKKSFLDGNVIFLQRLLKYSKNKIFIHFSTFSELYKNDFYQLSKMIGNSLLLTNIGLFERLKILYLPTLEDEKLIQDIVDSAFKGLMPKVDRLKYNYMTFECVADFVKQEIVEVNNNHISDFYVERDLYEEVVKRVDQSLVIEGIKIDRSLFDGISYYAMPQMLESLLE